jgi:hypothetical protein
MSLIGLASVAGADIAAATAARAQNCEAMSGPTRTVCFIGRARIFGQKSDIAAGIARQRTDKELLRAVTGTDSAPKLRGAKPSHKVRSGKLRGKGI